MNILILGGSSDIGIKVIEAFLKQGYNVTAHYNKNKKVFSNFIKKKNFSYIKLDLINSLKLEKFLNKNKKKFKKFDVFISLTGFMKIKKFINLSAQDILDHISANYISNLLVTQNLLNEMKKRKWGRILFASSIGTKFGGGTFTFAYSVSKYLNEFFPSEYKKYYKYNILINTLQIGVTNTKIHKKNKNKDMKKRINLIPIKRMAATEEVVDQILFLCSKKNKLITNQVINIAGGE